eukprot:225923-Chlamydomonas_euryale.AAC.2
MGVGRLRCGAVCSLVVEKGETREVGGAEKGGAANDAKLTEAEKTSMQCPCFHEHIHSSGQPCNFARCTMCAVLATLTFLAAPHAVHCYCCTGFSRRTSNHGIWTGFPLVCRQITTIAKSALAQA